MPYICMRRTDIENGVLQVTDLWPNSSQHSLVYGPVGQTKYLRGIENDTVTVVANVTYREYSGVTAYLLDTVANGTNGHALTVAQAHNMATDIIALVTSGEAATLVAVNAILDDYVTDTELEGNGSVGDLSVLLQILAGGHYVVPAGTGAASGSAFKGTASGEIVSGKYLSTFDGSALHSSLALGQLASLTSSSFSYMGATGAAVVVYDDTGAVLVP